MEQIFKNRNTYNPIGKFKKDFWKERELLEYLDNNFKNIGLGIGNKPTAITLAVTNDTENQDWSERSYDYWDMNYLATDKDSFNTIVLGKSLDIIKEILNLPHSNVVSHIYGDLYGRDNIHYGMFKTEISLCDESGHLIRKYTILFKYNEFNNINSKDMEKNKEIAKVLEIANKMGLDAFADEYTDVDTDQEMVSIQFRDEHSSMIVSIDVTPDASKKDISDELYMLADDFNEEFVESDKKAELKEEGYTDNQIDTMRRYINILYKNYTFG